LPLGSSGLRGNVGYLKTSYTLGKEFASTLGNGTAQVKSVGVSYPQLRSQKTNLNLIATYQDKQFNDEKDATFINEKKVQYQSAADAAV
jgi:hemolysin activation/secretion protein